jgi:hypothetical protein
MPTLRESSSKFDGQFTGRLVGDITHPIDRFTARAAGDHYPHFVFEKVLNLLQHLVEYNR